MNWIFRIKNIEFPIISLDESVYTAYVLSLGKNGYTLEEMNLLLADTPYAMEIVDSDNYLIYGFHSNEYKVTQLEETELGFDVIFTFAIQDITYESEGI